jgi:hypothetical protein
MILPIIKLANTTCDGPAPLRSPRWQALLPARLASPAPTAARAVSAFIGGLPLAIRFPFRAFLQYERDASVCECAPACVSV